MNCKFFARECSAILAAVSLTFFGGCSHEHPLTHSEPEPKTAQITLWSDRHELFIEHRMPVANTPITFVTHVSDLKTLQPRHEGPITFVLEQQGRSAIEHIEKSPSRPGIYEPSLTFPTPGDWSITVTIPTDTGFSTIALPPVKVFASAKEAEQAIPPKAPEGIPFLKEQQWRIGVATALAAKRPLVESMRLPATVSARPGSLAQVVVPISGRLLALPDQNLRTIGDHVEAGQLLALVQPSFSEFAARFTEAEARVARTKLQLEQAKLNFSRIETLAKAQARSARELQDAEFQLKTAQAAHDAALALQSTYAQSRTNLPGANSAASQPGVEIRSPIAGRITQQSGIAVGEFIPAEKHLFTILNSSTVFIQAQIPEASLARITSSPRATYALPPNLNQRLPLTGEGKGRLISLALQVDPATRSAPIIYEVPNPENRLRVGQSLTLFVETSHAEETLAIPNEAIVEEGGRPVAFVQLAGETFEKRDLTLGITDGSWVQVLDGIEPGERIVTKGAYAIRLASVSSSLPAHGHSH